MSFLVSADYSLVIKTRNLQLLLDELEPSAQADAEEVAMSVMDGYFRKRNIDCANVWNKTGVDRNKSVILMLLHLTVYMLHNGVDPDAIPKTRTDNNEMAMKWLKDVASGEVETSLPILEGDSNVPKNVSRFGSLPKFNSDY
ncbi:MAG TPA: DUF1320 family protein [Bacteroidia bacterium]|nr:DUF1320 family protein [Bacteroidia bacterium]